MPNIRKRGDTFQITVSLGYDENYKQIRKSLTYKPPAGTSDLKAKKLAEQAAYEFEIKCKGLTAYNENMTFRQLCEWYFETVAPNTTREITIECYKKRLETYVFSEFGNAKLREMTPARLDVFFANLKKNGSHKRYFKLRENVKPQDFFQAQIAKNYSQIGISYETVRSVMSGKNIRLENAEKIAKYADRPLSKIFEPASGTELSVRTVTNVVMVLSSVFTAAVKAGIMRENPIKRTTPPSMKSAEISEQAYLNEEQTAEFLRLLDKEEFGTLKVGLFVMLFVGLRSGEVFALHWSDYDEKNRMMTIRHTLHRITGKPPTLHEPKTKSSNRRLKVPNAVGEMLSKYKQWQKDFAENSGDKWHDNGIIFAGTDGGYLRKTFFNVGIKKIIKGTDLPQDLHPHSLRHTTASILINQGTNASTVAKQLGHSSPLTTTTIYTHVFQDAQAKAAEVIEMKLMGLIDDQKEK